MEKIDIRKPENRSGIPLELLLLADPSEASIAEYADRGIFRAAFAGDRVVGVAVLLKTRPFTMELVNLAVEERYQGQGIAKRLIAEAVETAREAGCRVLEVGTGNAGIGQLALYQKCGFSMTGIDRDYFRRHYPEPIFENGIECRHMVRLSMEL